MAKQYPAGTAYHEAGHAVVGHALGLRVQGIHINEHDEGGGAHIECAAKLSFVEQAALRLAGMKAQTMWKQESALPLGEDDNKRFVMQCSNLSNECREAIRMRAFELAGEKLEKHAGAVEAVAKHLIMHGKMTQAEFETVMGAQ